MLADLPGLEVVAAVADGAAAVEAAAPLRPDVVLMDLQMPGVGGLEATARIATGVPGVAVVVLTMNEDADTVFAALRAGARGYLLKEADRRRHRAGGPGGRRRRGGVRPADRRPGAALLLRRRRRGRAHAVPAAHRPASGRCSAWWRRAATTQTIARRLFLSDKTVRNHVSACLGKLQVATRAEAVALARDAGLGAPR